MNILISSHAFSPSIGGIETCSLQLAEGLRDLGHSVRIVTHTPSSDPRDDFGFPVLRCPSKSALIAALRWCDVFYQNNISLQTLWPLCFVFRPWYATTATWLHDLAKPPPLAARVKRFLLRFASNIYVSEAIARHVGHPGNVVPNPYNETLFRLRPEVPREGDLLFVGRLVPDKGCSLLLHSLSLLREKGLRPRLSIVGDGPERAALEQVASESLPGQVAFRGSLAQESCAREMNRHKVLVVPSLWEEPFGVVAVEGIACGCIPVASRVGGLPDAVGPCGFLFDRGSPEALANVLQKALAEPEAVPTRQATVTAHLAKHSRAAVAALHAAIFSKALGT